MRRSPREARLLGLWTAGCLAVLLLAGVLWVGDLTLQWPVFAVPLGWALIAARPRRAAASPAPRPARDDRYRDDDRYRADDRYGARDHGHPETREAPLPPPLPPSPPSGRPRDR